MKFESDPESDEATRNSKQSGITGTGGLSDGEDDSVERDTILKSPLKGRKRLSSVVRRSQPSLISLVLSYTAGRCCDGWEATFQL